MRKERAVKPAGRLESAATTPAMPQQEAVEGLGLAASLRRAPPPKTARRASSGLG